MRIPGFLLQQNIELMQYLGESAYGPIYSEEPAELKARVSFTTGLTKDKEGQDTVYNADVMLFPEAKPLATVGSIIKYEDKQLVIISSAPVVGLAGETVFVKVEAAYG